VSDLLFACVVTESGLPSAHFVLRLPVHNDGNQSDGRSRLQSEEPLRQFETVHVGQPDVRKYYTRRPRRGYYQSVIGIINVYRSGEPHVGHARSVMLQRTVGAPLEE
jgi:hypothetical protein